MVACTSERPSALEPPVVPLAVPRSTAATVGSEAKVVAREEGASFLIQIQFKPKSYDLTDAARQILRELVTKASARGEIDKIHLIVWSDKEYPSTRRRALSADQVRLADRRAKAVNDYLRDRDVKAEVEAYNMAERPNPILSILSAADARIKKTLEGAGMATTAQDLARPEYAAKAVVLVLLAK
jgi:outer membrane protein OmpA-like peptidoglycan-associated protein